MSQPSTITEPTLEALDAWPPRAHLVRPWEFPIKPGTIALCGARLMGVDLRNTRCSVCDRCLELAEEILKIEGRF